MQQLECNVECCDGQDYATLLLLLMNRTTCMQVFLTANPKLRSEVAKQFHKLRAATLNDAVESKRLEELSGRDYKSLADVPSEAFPVFWTTAQFLRAVDATLPDTPTRKGPFFPRYAVHCCHCGLQARHAPADQA